jgi:hypothetical protein
MGLSPSQFISALFPPQATHWDRDIKEYVTIYFIATMVSERSACHESTIHRAQNPRDITSG